MKNNQETKEERKEGEIMKKERKGKSGVTIEEKDGKKYAVWRFKQVAPIIEIEKLREVDRLTPEFYQEYYTFLLPFLEKWYNCLNGKRYRPVVIGKNIVANLAKNNLRMKCHCSIECPIPSLGIITGIKGDIVSEVNKNKHMILNPLPGTKFGCYRCEFVDKIPNEFIVELGDVGVGLNEDVDLKDLKRLKPKLPRDPMISGFDRYVTFSSKKLYYIDMLMQKRTMFRGIRTLYYQPCIRSQEMIGEPTDNSFNQIIGLNPVIDIDVLNKSVKTIFDYWEENFDMMVEISDILDENDQEYVIMSSGNGWYFLLKQITMMDFLEEEGIKDKSSFWNIVTEGTKAWLTDNIKVIQDKYHYDIQVGNMNPMKFLKTPFSIHQLHDWIATPITLDMLNTGNRKEGKDEFLSFVSVENIKETFEKCEKLGLNKEILEI